MKPGLSTVGILLSGCASILIAVGDARGEVAHGITEVGFGQGVVFGTAPIGLSLDYSDGSFNSKDDFKNSDLFAATTFCPLCLTCCCAWEIGSTRPFYRSKARFDSTDFSQPLDLHDTSEFAMLDTTRSGAVVVYPHTGYAQADGRFFVFSNSGREYVLMRIREVLKEDPIGPAATHQCENRIKAEWWIQSNGQAFFPAPTGLSRPNAAAGIRNPGDAYLINGSKIIGTLRIPACRFQSVRAP